MSSAIIGALRAVLGMDTAAFEDGVGRAQKQGKSLEKSMKKIGKNLSRTGAKMSAALTAPLVGIAYKSIAAQKEQEQAIAAVEAKLASMGETAGFTSAELQSMASVLQEGSLYGDEAILQRVTQNLLSFGNIQGEVFERGQQLALDLSATLGQDLQSSTLLLGKALNDPVKGLSALTRVGISFTEEQKNQIKAMAETGRVAEAQRLILSELESQYGGSAAALANTDSGKITQAWNAVGDAMESVGAVILPVLADLSQYLKSAAEWFQSLDPVTQEYSVIAGALAAALGPAVTALGLMMMALAPMAGVIAAIISPLGLLVAALTAVATAIYVNWDGLEQDFPAITGAISAGIDLAIAAFERIKDVVAVVFAAVTEQIRNAATLIEALLSGDFVGAFDAGKAMVQTAVDGWLSIIGAAFGVDLKAKFSAGVQAARDFGRDLVAYIRSLATEIWEAAKLLGQDLIDGIKAGFNEKVESLKASIRSIANLPEWIFRKETETQSPSRVFKRLGGYLMDGLALGITGGQADVASAMDGVDDALAISGGAFAGMTGELEYLGSMSESVFGSMGGHVAGLIKGTTDLGDVLSSVLGTLSNGFLGSAMSDLRGMLTGGFGDGIGGFLADMIGGLVGFANGGSFEVGGVGGIDSQLVAFKASPNERVSITKPGQEISAGSAGARMVQDVNVVVGVDPATGNLTAFTQRHAALVSGGMTQAAMKAQSQSLGDRSSDHQLRFG